MMKIGIGVVGFAIIAALGLWMAGIIGGETVLGTRWLNNRSGGSPGDQVIIVIGKGGVPDGLAPDTEVTIGSLKTGEAYCRAKIVETMDTPHGPGYGTICIEAR